LLISPLVNPFATNRAISMSLRVSNLTLDELNFVDASCCTEKADQCRHRQIVYSTTIGLKILDPKAMIELPSDSGIDRNTTVIAVHNSSFGTPG